MKVSIVAPDLGRVSARVRAVSSKLETKNRARVIALALTLTLFLVAGTDEISNFDLLKDLAEVVDYMRTMDEALE